MILHQTAQILEPALTMYIEIGAPWVDGKHVLENTRQMSTSGA